MKGSCCCNVPVFNKTPFYSSCRNLPFKSTRRASRKCVTRCQRGPTWACQVTWRLPDDSVILQMADVPPYARKHLPGGDMCGLRMTLTRATERHLSDGALVLCKLQIANCKKKKTCDAIVALSSLWMPPWWRSVRHCLLSVINENVFWLNGHKLVPRCATCGGGGGKYMAFAVWGINGMVE